MAKALDNYCIKGTQASFFSQYLSPLQSLTFPSSPPHLPLPGVNHYIPMLRDIITQPKFISGDINTNFIKEVYPKGFRGQWVGPHNWFCIAKLYVCCSCRS